MSIAEIEIRLKDIERKASGVVRGKPWGYTELSDTQWLIETIHKLVSENTQPSVTA